MSQVGQKIGCRLEKMETQFGVPIQYFLQSDDGPVPISSWIGKTVDFTFSGKMTCLSCNKLLRKTYFQGYCYDCAMRVPELSECVIRPELCRAQFGEGRDPQWEQTHHNQPHVVYLAASGGIKIGVTRAGNETVRWADQGADQAAILFETPNRYTAGVIECALKPHRSDRTNWRKMLTQRSTEFDLVAESEEIFPLVSEHRQYRVSAINVVDIEYPISDYPDKVKSLNLDKTPIFSYGLRGVKGQYLIFEDGWVLNVRRYGGYHVSLSVTD